MDSNEPHDGMNSAERRGEDRRASDNAIEFADRRKTQRRKLADRRAKARTIITR